MELSGLMTTVPCGAVAAVTLSVSPSGSVSLARGVIVTGTSSFVLAVSLTAVGPGLLIVQANVRVVESGLTLFESVAVMLTLNTPLLPWLADLSIVPVISPVAGLIERPVGRPVAENVSVSPASISLNNGPSGSETLVPSTPVRSAKTAGASGASLTGTTVIVATAVEKPPRPSEIV